MFKCASMLADSGDPLGLFTMKKLLESGQDAQRWWKIKINNLESLGLRLD
jgi:hypothetical protein